MSNLIAKEPESKEFELPPEGNSVTRCYQILDLGTQMEAYDNQEAKPKHKVVIFWELLDEDYKQSNGKPHSIRKEYTLSLDRKATLRADLQAWRGVAFTEEELQGFDLENVLGKYCRMQIVHNESNGKTYANISSIMAMKNSESKPEAVNADRFFDITVPDLEIFNTLPDYWKEKIEAAQEWEQVGKVASIAKDNVPAEISDEPINLNDIPL